MSDYDFKYPLESIDPKKIIEHDVSNNRLNNFFLILSLISNDIKDILTYRIFVDKHFNEIAFDTTTANSTLGEYAGMKNHLERMMISSIHEFFLFIKKFHEQFKKDGDIDTYNLNGIFNSLPASIRLKWKDFIDSSLEVETGSFLEKYKNIILLTRNNGASHYWGIEKPIKNGFKKHFFETEDVKFLTEKAYYSTGNTISKNRFYYADAAAEGIFRNYLHQNNVTNEDYLNATNELLSKLHSTITPMINVWLSSLKEEQ